MAASAEQMTTLTLELRKETTEKLKLRMPNRGRMFHFVSDLVEHFSAPPTSIEVSAEISIDVFLKAG